MSHYLVPCIDKIFFEVNNLLVLIHLGIGSHHFEEQKNKRTKEGSIAAPILCPVDLNLLEICMVSSTSKAIRHYVNIYICES